MKNTTLAGYILSGISVVGIIVLAATNHTIPDVLSAVALVSGAGSVGATIPQKAAE